MTFEAQSWVKPSHKIDNSQDKQDTKQVDCLVVSEASALCWNFIVLARIIYHM